MGKMNSFAWVLILLCTANFLSSFAHEDSQMLRSKDDSDIRKLMASENITLTEKGQKGKGSYGGANVVHRRPAEKNAALPYRPCFFISSTILGFSFFLPLDFPFPLS